MLPYEQNTVSFGFAGLGIQSAAGYTISLSLQGYDNDWIMAGNSHQASYTKIPPGIIHFLSMPVILQVSGVHHIKALKSGLNLPGMLLEWPISVIVSFWQA